MFNMVMVARGTETASQRCSVKKVVLKDFAKFTGKHLYFRPQAYKFLQKETLAEVFSCEFCEIFKNTSFYRTPLGDCLYCFAAHHVALAYGLPYRQLFMYIQPRTDSTLLLMNRGKH